MTTPMFENYFTLDVRLIQNENEEYGVQADEIRQTPLSFGWSLTVDGVAKFVADQDGDARYVIGVLNDHA